MSITSSPLVCRLFINRGLNGWSERWPLATWDFAQGVIDAGQLAQARANVLAATARVEWGVCAQVAEPYAEQAAFITQLQPLPIWDYDNVDGIGLLWRFQTAQGQWGNHLFRAVDRTELGDRSWIRAPFPLPDGIPPLPANPLAATKDQLWANTLCTFRALTAFHQALPPPLASPPIWDIIPWSEVTFRMVSSRNPGRPYRRVSWESLTPAAAPAFSPCGEAVSVLRSCYTAKCRFYADGSPQRIHYYFAQAGASVLAVPHIFWGRARANELSNTLGPGEITGVGNRTWDQGVSFGVAPGNHSSGTPLDFLGQTLLPWTPETPTPIGQRPACDLPHPFLTYQNGRAVEFQDGQVVRFN